MSAAEAQPAEERIDRPARPERHSKVVKDMLEDDALDLREWIDGLAGDGSVRITIRRKKPMLGPNGENIVGSLETVDERIDEDYLRDVWGGGTYEIRVFKPNGKGNWEYFKTRTLVIAGEPKMQGRLLVPGGAAPAAPVGGDDPLADRAFGVMERTAQRAQERAERLEEVGHRGLDIGALQAFNAPLLQQLEAAQTMINNLQTQVLAASTRQPPTDPFRDKMLDRMMDGDTARIEALRTQYDTRIEKMQDSFDDRLRRMEEKHADELKAQEKRHERELDMAQRSVDVQTKSSDVSYQTRIDSLKEQIGRLERELTESRSRIGALEQRKDQTITDKADELIKIKEALDGLGGDGDGDDKKWYEKLIEVVGSSEAAMALVNKIGGATGAAPGAQQQMLPPVGVPFQGPDGLVYVRNPDNTVAVVDPRALRQQRALAVARKKRRAQAAAGSGAPAAPAESGAEDMLDELEDEVEDVRPPSATEMKAAIAFMENAIRSNADPAVFGATARNLIPGEVLGYMQQVGIDDFLNKARLDSGSPLTSQVGRNFARKVFKFLTEGTTE